MTTQQKDVLDNPNYISVLDHGFVGLVDSMGNDSSIVRAARVSYGSGTKQVNEDRGLIRYLMKHKHTTPFEMVEYCFHLKLPIFVARQHIRHRMASVNEYSGRYSVMSNEFYSPNLERIKGQSLTNKQGSGDELSTDNKLRSKVLIDELNDYAYERYSELMSDDIGMSRELSRIVLPVSNYTEMYWKIDLKNLLNYIFLREDSHAQEEIREYATAMASFVRNNCPIAYEAYEDYVKNGKELSRMDIKLLHRLHNMCNTFNCSLNFAWEKLTNTWKENNESPTKQTGMSKREIAEFCYLWKLTNERK